MRHIWAFTTGITLSLGSAAAIAQENPWATRGSAPAGDAAPAVSLGRPIPAATLGRPTGLTPASGSVVQPTAFETDPWATTRRSTIVAPGEPGPILLPNEARPATLLGDAGGPAKPMPLADGAMDPTPAPAVPPAASALPGAPGCGGGLPGMTVDGTGFGGCGGFGCCLFGDGNSLFPPFFPYAGPNTNRFWVNTEFLLWFAKDARVPALAITTAVLPTNAVPRPQPETVLFGDGAGGIYPTNRYGGRFNAGFWFSPAQCRGLDFSYFFLGTASTNFAVSDQQFANISRPFFNLNRNEPFVQIVTGTGVSTGTLAITGQSSLWGAEANYRRGLFREMCGLGRVDAIVGFRYLHLDESLNISETFASRANPIPGVVAASGTVFDSFATRNDFYGGQLGLIMERQWGRWSIDASAKVGLGATTNRVNISGGQNLILNGVPTTANAGLLALATNSGNFSGSAFSVVPEATINLGYQITPRLKFFVGYSFLYWNNVVRPGDQIDTGIDVTRIPNFNPLDRNGAPITQPVANRPAFTFNRTDFWAQGVNFGLQLKW